MARLLDNATNDRYEIDVAPATALPVSLGGWFYSDDGAAQQYVIFLGDKDQDDRWVAVRLNSGNVEAIHRWDGTAVSATASAGYSTNTWHHGLGVFAGTADRRVYMDGANKGTDTGTEADITEADRTTVGERGSATRKWNMSGRLAQLAMWNVALTDGEAAALGAGVLPIHVRPTALIGYWPFQGLVSPEVDYSSQGNDLTYGGTGAPTQASPPPVQSWMFDSAVSFVAAAAPGGLSIPVAMHQYRRLRNVPV